MNDLLEDDISALRLKFKTLEVIVAEIDKELRYKWIENPHSDFDPNNVIGKRDDELIPAKDAEGIISFKKKIFETGKAQMATLPFNLPSGFFNYNISGYPVKNSHGQTTGIITFGFYTERTSLKKV